MIALANLAILLIADAGRFVLRSLRSRRSQGPIAYALQKYGFFVLFPINPATLAKYREAFKPGGAKDDPTEPNSPSIYCSATRSDSHRSSRKVRLSARYSA